MPIQVNAPGWRIRSVSRGSGAPAPGPLEGLPSLFLTADSHVADETVLEAAPVTRGRPVSGGPLDLSVDVPPDRGAQLAIRRPIRERSSRRPVSSAARGTRGPSQVRFQATVRSEAGGTTRGLVSQAAKAIVVSVARLGGDRLVSLLLPKLVATFESRSWA